MHDPRISLEPIQRAKVDATGTAQEELVAAVAGCKIRVVSGFMISGGICTATFQSASTAISGTMSLVAQSEIPIHECRWGTMETNVGEALNLNIAGDSISIEGWINYQIIGSNRRIS